MSDTEQDDHQPEQVALEEARQKARREQLRQKGRVPIGELPFPEQRELSFVPTADNKLLSLPSGILGMILDHVGMAGSLAVSALNSAHYKFFRNSDNIWEQLLQKALGKKPKYGVLGPRIAVLKYLKDRRHFIMNLINEATEQGCKVFGGAVRDLCQTRWPTMPNDIDVHCARGNQLNDLLQGLRDDHNVTELSSKQSPWYANQTVEHKKYLVINGKAQSIILDVSVGGRFDRKDIDFDVNALYLSRRVDGGKFSTYVEARKEVGSCASVIRNIENREFMAASRYICLSEGYQKRLQHMLNKGYKPAKPARYERGEW
jgi:hypothetical protein